MALGNVPSKLGEDPKAEIQCAQWHAFVAVGEGSRSKILLPRRATTVSPLPVGNTQKLEACRGTTKLLLCSQNCLTGALHFRFTARVGAPRSRDTEVLKHTDFRELSVKELRPVQVEGRVLQISSSGKVTQRVNFLHPPQSCSVAAVAKEDKQKLVRLDSPYSPVRFRAVSLLGPKPL